MTNLTPDADILININDRVRVRLTPEGHRELKNRHNHLFGDKGCLPYRDPDEDEDGWSEWHLWELMSKFAERTFMGGPQFFKKNAIVIVGAIK